jgi:hypothetical protein
MKAPEKECFKLIQQIALLQDPYCITCGKPSTAGHHLYGRGLAVAFNPECVRGMCVECHDYAHRNRFAFRGILRDVVLGPSLYDDLEVLSRTSVPDMDFEAKRDELRTVLADLEGSKS